MTNRIEIQAPLDLPPPAALDWLAGASQRWLERAGIQARDVVVLVPHVQLLPPVREAFARAGGWQPQVDTLETWAMRSGREVDTPLPGADATRDLTQALLLLQAQPWAQEALSRQPGLLQASAMELVQCAAQLAAGAQRQPLEGHEAFWSQVQGLVRRRQGQGAWHHGLLQLAAQWAAKTVTTTPAQAPGPLPAGWIVLSVGGSSHGLQAHANAHATIPTLWVNADASVADPFGAFLQPAVRPVWVCDSLETEAHATLVALLDALAQQEGLVAMVAQDRLLARRVRALLERAGVAWIDETGWRLSTTQAAASVMSWLRAAGAPPRSDAWLDWLKSGACPQAMTDGLTALEAHWRDGVRLGTARGRASAVPALVGAVQAWAVDALAPLAFAGQQTLWQWLQRLGQALSGCGQLDALCADDAGFKVVTALHLREAALAAMRGGGVAGLDHAEDLLLDLDGFTRWVDGVLEQHHFTAPAQVAARVVFLPLEQALWRPFAAIVVPAADAVHLGGAAVTAALLGDAEAKHLGLPHAQQRSQQQALAFAQLLRVGHVQFIYRQFVDGEPQRPCPWLVWWDLKRRQAKVAPLEFRPWVAPRRALLTQPLTCPAPVAANALPPTWSASAVEALRVCPYRFFARHILRLQPAQELDDAGQGFKRDHGTWLHETLLAFHRQRQVGADDADALLAAGEALLTAWQVPPADAVPMRASFQSLVPVYVQWLHERDAQGWAFADGERSLLAPLPGLPDVMLKGILDRIDERAQVPAARQLLDYKTTAKKTLVDRVKLPAEDTQLAFYALLAQLQLPAHGELSSAYLTVDGKDAGMLVPHVNVVATAQALQDGLVVDISRLRAGHGLPALGTSADCEHCDARGLCRRDDWGVA